MLGCDTYRWKGRPFVNVAGGVYDMRARFWSPAMGAFLTIDGYAYDDANSTLWGWPGQNPIRWADPSGHDPYSVYCYLVGCNGSGPGWLPRAPDYYSGTVNVGGSIGGTANVTVTSGGDTTLSCGYNAGKSSTVVSGSLTAGWFYDQRDAGPNPPNASLNVGGGFILGGSWNTQPSGDSVEVGLYTPQFGVSVVHTVVPLP
jgi:RHS repeat-associated protein